MVREALTLVCALALAACASLPDTSGYTAVTVDLKQSIASVGTAVESEFRAAAAPSPEDSEAETASKQQLLGQADQFKAAWNTQGEALDAAVRYAESIEAIVSAGNKGGESARQIADQASGLVAALGLAATPASPLATGLVNGLGEIGKIVANVRAAKSLATAVSAATPLIVRLQDLLQKQLDTTAPYFDSFLLWQQQDLRLKPDGKLLFISQGLNERRVEILTALSVNETAGSLSAAELKARRERLEALEALQKSLDPGVARANARLEELDRRRRAGHSLFAASNTALAEWGAAHAKVARAIETRQPVTAESLTAAISDLRKLIEEWRSL